MPEISRFYGIVIRMFYDDHNPPHFHALYGDDEAWISINNLALMYGNLPSRALGWLLSGHPYIRKSFARIGRWWRKNKTPIRSLL